MNTDMTYCQNISCPFDDCDRHSCHIFKEWDTNKDKESIVVLLSNFDATCRKYISWLVDKNTIK